MKAQALKDNEGKTRLWFCSRCNGYRHSSEEDAEKCCICDDCGKEVDHNYSNTQCTSCQSIARKKREIEKLAKAEDVTDTYEGPLCFNNDWYDSVEALLDYLEEVKEEESDVDLDDSDRTEIPEWIYGTHTTKMEIDADNIIENLLADHYEDADEDTLVDVKGLREFLSQWNAKQIGETWWEDNTKKINVKKLMERK